MVGYCENNDTFGVGPIYERKREAFQEHPPGVLRGRRARQRKFERARRGLLNGRSKAGPQLPPFPVVVADFGEKLAARRRDESRACHRDSRRASAKTSSAAYAGISPRSN